MESFHVYLLSWPTTYKPIFLHAVGNKVILLHTSYQKYVLHTLKKKYCYYNLISVFFSGYRFREASQGRKIHLEAFKTTLTFKGLTGNDVNLITNKIVLMAVI